MLTLITFYRIQLFNILRNIIIIISTSRKRIIPPPALEGWVLLSSKFYGRGQGDVISKFFFKIPALCVGTYSSKLFRCLIRNDQTKKNVSYFDISKKFFLFFTILFPWYIDKVNCTIEYILSVLRTHKIFNYRIEVML